MEVGTARGKHKTEEALRNKERVRAFFEGNKGAGVTACKRELNLSYLTVRKHIDAINSEE